MARRSLEGEKSYVCKQCDKPSKSVVIYQDKDSTFATCIHCGFAHFDDIEFWLDVWPAGTSPDDYGYSGGTEWRADGKIRTL